MIPSRLGAVILLASSFTLAKSPTDSASICDRYKQSDLIFTGSADGPWVAVFETGRSPIHKRSEKSKRIRFLVREWYKGKRQSMINVWMTPSDCPLKIEANQMYLIYARVNQANGRIESNACMGTQPADKANADLVYLQAAQSGTGWATQISGMAGEGANVVARSEINTRYAIAGSDGRYVLNGLAPGDWNLSIPGGHSQPTHLEPNSCVTQDLSH